MPIEIRELVVRARVEPNAAPAEKTAATGSKGAGSDDESITRACVKEVLRILEAKRER